MSAVRISFICPYLTIKYADLITAHIIKY